jgi:hypothetical protein
MTQSASDHYQVSVGGAVGGNVVVGRDNQIVTTPGVSAADLAAFAAAVAELKARVAATPEAAAQLDALHAAATAPTPDLDAMQRVRSWFMMHLPTLAGAVTGLVVHPVVGALVKSAGDAVAAEFHRRFGDASKA